MMKWLWGRKKKDEARDAEAAAREMSEASEGVPIRAGDPEIPEPSPEPFTPEPPEEPEPIEPPGEPYPTPDPIYPPDEPAPEIPQPDGPQLEMAWKPYEPESLREAAPPPGPKEAPAPPEPQPPEPLEGLTAETAEEIAAEPEGLAPDEEQLPSKPPTSKGGGFFSRLTQGVTQAFTQSTQGLAEGLRRTSSRLTESISAVFKKRKLDAGALDELEEILIAADLGPGPAGRVIAQLSAEKFDKEVTDEEVRDALADVVMETLAPHERDFDLSGPAPQVILFVGVNGSGKTTTAGKIASMIGRQGRSVVMAAGDTFRAAAVEQLQAWGERTRAPVIARETGADAAGLVYDAYTEAKRRDADVLLVDTAGRLQNKTGLMQELAKIVRVLKKQDPTAPHHVLLVLDATVGQNALSQAQAFREIAGVTGLVMTKLDGTAKGGVLVALADAHPDLPIYFTGVGEGVDDLKPFSARDLARALAGAESEMA